MNPEPLKELPVTPVEIPPLDRRYVTVGYWRNRDGEGFWNVDAFETLKNAQHELEDAGYVPGTMRIFEVPKERN